MLMGAMRCNIPTVFVSGGPMEAGKTADGKTVDLIDVFVGAAAKQSGKLSAEELLALEKAGCPTCGSCSGMFTANSMNCLCEALGMALPDQRHAAGHQRRPQGALPSRGRAGRGDGPGVRQEGRRPRPVAARDRHRRIDRQLDDSRHGDGRQHEHGAAHPGHRPRGGRALRHRADQHAQPPHAQRLQGRAQQQLPRGERPQLRRRPHDPRRGPPRPARIC